MPDPKVVKFVRKGSKGWTLEELLEEQKKYPKFPTDTVEVETQFSSTSTPGTAHTGNIEPEKKVDVPTVVTDQVDPMPKTFLEDWLTALPQGLPNDFCNPGTQIIS